MLVDIEAAALYRDPLLKAKNKKEKTKKRERRHPKGQYDVRECNVSNLK